MAGSTVVEGAVVGVAGCGAMGLPMAQRLHAAGFEVCGFDIRPLGEFGEFRHHMVADPQAFARRVDVVFSVVRDIEETLRLCFDEQGIFAALPRARTLVVSSTVSPRHLGKIRRRLPSRVALLDAPMSGAPYSARQGDLTFMVGGRAGTLRLVMPYLQAMGGAVHHLGPLGAGMTVKVLNNYVASASTVAVRRAYDMAAALDIDIEALREIMAQSSGATWFGDNFERIDWSRQGYQRDNTIGILEKDTLAALDAVKGIADVRRHPFDDAVLEGLRALEAFTR